MKARQVDRSLVELERVVRSQTMCRRWASATENGNINNHLRATARLALTAGELRERHARESGNQPAFTKRCSDVKEVSSK